MKKIVIILSLIFCFSCNQKSDEAVIAELSCGQCQFGLSSAEGCDLAVRFDGNAYFVDGANINDFGDAHDKETGFCEVVRKGEVKGKLVLDRFKVSSIKLLDN